MYGKKYTAYFISHSIDINYDDIDKEWERCLQIAEDFHNSDYDDMGRPFADCLNDYLRDKGLMKKWD